MRELVKMVQPAESSHELATRWRDEQGTRHSHWDLLRASLIYHAHFKSRFPFYTVSEDLGRMKADQVAVSSHAVVGDIYQLLHIPSKTSRKQEEATCDFSMDDEDADVFYDC